LRQTRRRMAGQSPKPLPVDIADGYTRNHLLPIWGGHRLCDLRARTLDAWIVDLHRDGKLAPATINKLLQTLPTILDQAVLEGWLAENPARHARSVRVTRPERLILTFGEAARFLGGSEPWDDFRHYAINVLAATTGMRMGEVRALLLENVQTDQVESAVGIVFAVLQVRDEQIQEPVPRHLVLSSHFQGRPFLASQLFNNNCGFISI